MALVLAGCIFRVELGGVAASSVPLPQGFAFAPLHQGDGEPAFVGFDRLIDDVSAAASGLSARGRVVYVEAEFFGGTGSQAALGWEGGRVAFGPLLTQTPGEGRDGYTDVPAGEDLAIDRALRWLGVSADGAHDEFDALGLGELDELDRAVGGDDRWTVVVESFLDALDRLSNALGGSLDGGRLFGLRRSRHGRGALACGVHFSVHGAGCRFTLLDGAEVDVDVDAAGTGVVFDAWRVRAFASSVGYELTAADAPALRAALVRTARVEEARPGWFRLADSA